MKSTIIVENWVPATAETYFKIDRVQLATDGTMRVQGRLKLKDPSLNDGYYNNEKYRGYDMVVEQSKAKFINDL